MISVQEAIRLIAQNAPVFQTEILPLEMAYGKVLAQDISSERNQPPFHRMAMDGIAINFQKWQEGLRDFKIEDIQRAGVPQKSLQDLNNCLEGMTGGVLPENCSAVIRYEDVTIENGVAKVDLNIDVQMMNNVHQFGEDHKAGDVLLEKGQKIMGPQVGIMASNGYSEVCVYQTPNIAVISTGDELVDFDHSPLPHQIRKSNPYALKAELNGHGYQKINLFHLADEQSQIFDKLQNILKDHQILILSGGVSMGKFDFIPKILSDLKVEKIFHKISQRPGKPFWFGKGQSGQSVFALPGNPISCLTCLRRYVIPSLNEALHDRNLNHRYAVLTEDYQFNKDLTYFCPVTIKEGEDGTTYATPIKTNGSGDYGALATSQGLLEFDLKDSLFKKGQAYPFFPWSES